MTSQRGSIRKRGPNSYRIAVYTGNHPTPYLYASAKSQESAERERDRLLTIVGKGQHLGPTRTLTDLFAQYLDTTDRLAENTRVSYRQYVDYYVTPYIGKVKVADLKASTVDALYRQLTEKGLAAGTIIKVDTIIRSAMRQAVIWDWISDNPAREVRAPKSRRKGIVVPTDDQIRALAKVAADDGNGDFAIYLKLATVTGCRRGEMLALQWSAVDWDKGRLSIHQKMVEMAGEDHLAAGTKTGETRTRRITLDKVTLDLLTAHQTAQDARISAVGGDRTGDTFLFADEPLGNRPWPCNRTSKRFIATCEAAGVVGVRLHDLRHYMATRLIMAGVPVHIVSERLGHSSPQTTWKVYFHYIEGDDGGAGEIMGDVFE